MFWQSVLGQVLVGLISNIVFILLITILGLGYVRAVIGRRSRPLRRLLGVGQTVPPTVKIMVSNIYVVRGGTVGVRVQRTGFYGSVMNQSEYVFALRLADAIRTAPAAKLFRALLDQLGLLDPMHESLDCSIVFSPQYVESADGGPVSADEYVIPELSREGPITERIVEELGVPGVYILLGGPAYNVAVYYALTHLRDRTRFRFVLHEASSGGMRGIAVAGYNLDGSEEFFAQEVPSGDGSPVPDYFVVQKISGFGPGGASVFICSGLSSLGTAMAAQLLASRWRTLEEEFHADDFALLYRFQQHRDVALPDPRSVDAALATAERIWPR